MASIICAAAVIDFIDGYIARTWLAHKEDNRIFGKQLDSLADLLNFSVAPALIMLDINHGVFSILAAAALVISGTLRLSVFSVISNVFPGCYRGLPTTYAGFIFAVLFQIISAGKMTPNILPICMLVISLLQVINLRVPKYAAVPTVSFFLVFFCVVSFIVYFPI